MAAANESAAPIEHQTTFGELDSQQTSDLLCQLQNRLGRHGWRINIDGLDETLFASNFPQYYSLADLTHLTDELVAVISSRLTIQTNNSATTGGDSDCPPTSLSALVGPKRRRLKRKNRGQNRHQSQPSILGQYQSKSGSGGNRQSERNPSGSVSRNNETESGECALMTLAMSSPEMRNLVDDICLRLQRINGDFSASSGPPGKKLIATNKAHLQQLSASAGNCRLSPACDPVVSGTSNSFLGLHHQLLKGKDGGDSGILASSPDNRMEPSGAQTYFPDWSMAQPIASDSRVRQPQSAEALGTNQSLVKVTQSVVKQSSRRSNSRGGGTGNHETEADDEGFAEAEEEEEDGSTGTQQIKCNSRLSPDCSTNAVGAKVANGDVPVRFDLKHEAHVAYDEEAVRDEEDDEDSASVGSDGGSDILHLVSDSLNKFTASLRGVHPHHHLPSAATSTSLATSTEHQQLDPDWMLSDTNEIVDSMAWHTEYRQSQASGTPLLAPPALNTPDPTTFITAAALAAAMVKAQSDQSQPVGTGCFLPPPGYMPHESGATPPGWGWSARKCQPHQQQGASSCLGLTAAVTNGLLDLIPAAVASMGAGAVRHSTQQRKSVVSGGSGNGTGPLTNQNQAGGPAGSIGSPGAPKVPFMFIPRREERVDSGTFCDYRWLEGSPPNTGGSSSALGSSPVLDLVSMDCGASNGSLNNTMQRGVGGWTGSPTKLAAGRSWGPGGEGMPSITNPSYRPGGVTNPAAGCRAPNSKSESCCCPTRAGCVWPTPGDCTANNSSSGSTHQQRRYRSNSHRNLSGEHGGWPGQYLSGEVGLPSAGQQIVTPGESEAILMERQRLGLGESGQRGTKSGSTSMSNANSCGSSTANLASSGGSKQPLEKWRRACSFYLRGHCKKEDCEFAHDLTRVTCKFWEMGECFKGVTCPFLHGYPGSD